MEIGLSKRKSIFLAIITAAVSLGAALTIIQPFASVEKNGGIESAEDSSSVSSPSLESRRSRVYQLGSTQIRSLFRKPSAKWF
jgi:hypothetical protein